MDHYFCNPHQKCNYTNKWPDYIGNINQDATRPASQLTNGESGWPYTKRRPKWKEKS
jgi:hypothetical protein